MKLHKFNQAEQRIKKQCGFQWLEYVDIESNLCQRFSKQTSSIKKFIKYTELNKNIKSHQVIHQIIDSKITILPRQEYLSNILRELLNPNQLKQHSCLNCDSAELFTSKGKSNSGQFYSFSAIPSNTYPPSVQANTLSSTLQIESTYVILDTS